MLSADLLFQIAVLAMLAILSLSSAVVARGPVRTTIAYALFVINLGIIAAFVLLKLNSLGGPTDSEEAALIRQDSVVTPIESSPVVELPSPEEVLPKKDTVGDIIEIPPEEEPAAPVIDKGPILAEFKSIQSQGISVANSLEAFTIGELKKLSDEEYESLINEANNMANQAQRLLRRFGKIANRDAVPAADRKMALGLNTLNQSARSLRSFFNAENAAEEAEFRANYKRFASQAKSQFQSALN